jgi:hypothetical protein
VGQATAVGTPEKIVGKSECAIVGLLEALDSLQ